MTAPGLSSPAQLINLDPRGHTHKLDVIDTCQTRRRSLRLNRIEELFFEAQ
jgi:hypothetical protein